MRRNACAHKTAWDSHNINLNVYSFILYLTLLIKVYEIQYTGLTRANMNDTGMVQAGFNFSNMGSVSVYQRMNIVYIDTL